MNNITIDAPSGDVAVRTMIKHIMPHLRDSGILKTVHRILKDYNGPKMSTRLINGRFMTVATLGLCYDILDRMSGPSWRDWRASKGNGFKQALRESVERKRCSVQIEQPQPQEQVEEVETKASLLQRALRSINIIGSVRIDKTSGKASYIDLIRLLCPEASPEYAAQMLIRILARDDRVSSIKSRTSYIKINGRGNITPVADFATLVEVLWMLPSGASRALRRKAAEALCRVMGGDTGLCLEIEQNNLAWMSIDGGDTMQQALIKPVDYKEHECSNRVKESSVRDALAFLVDGKTEVWTPSGLIDVLSESEVIEVKYYRKWKDAFGQVMAYGSHYPHLAKRLHLFAHIGDTNTQKYFELAKSLCDDHSIEVTFEETGVEDSVLGVNDDTITVVCDDKEASGVKRTRTGDDWNHFGYQSRSADKQESEPFWFKYGTAKEKRDYVCRQFGKSEIDFLKSCKAESESVGRFDERDEFAYDDKIRGVKRRAAAVDDTAE